MNTRAGLRDKRDGLTGLCLAPPAGQTGIPGHTKSRDIGAAARWRSTRRGRRAGRENALGRCGGERTQAGGGIHQSMVGEGFGER